MEFKNMAHRCLAAGPTERRLRQYVWSAQWLRQAEPTAAASQGISLYELMQRAGLAAFRIFRMVYPETKHWLILAGSGNNGGDGYEVARHAVSAGVRVTVMAVPQRNTVPAEAAAAQAAWVAIGGSTQEVVGEPFQIPNDVDLVVDGLLGTGSSGAPRGTYAALIEAVNSLSVPRVAIDIPSGLNAESGLAPGACLRASHTVTFISLKPGLLTGKARDFVGQVHYDSLQMSEWLLSSGCCDEAMCCRLSWEDVGKYFGVPRRSTSHKGDSGKVVVIGGERGFGGAIIMTAEAALHAGAGMVRVVTKDEHVTAVLSRIPEAMTEGIPDDADEDTIKNTINGALQWATVIAVGPGLGSRLFGRVALHTVLQHAADHPDKPLVIDADALNGITGMRQRGDPLPRVSRSIITPHPGEAARLLQCKVDEVENDRFASVRSLAQILGGVALLKGPGTLVHRDDSGTSASKSRCTFNNTAIIDAGNGGMATGGMGDVLTGVIAGVAGQNPSCVYTVTCAGALVHAVAADLAVARNDYTRGLRPTELFPYVTMCVNAKETDT